jgi:hypothetical protein
LHCNNASAQYVTRTAKDTATNAVTHYIIVPSTVDGITGIEASVTKISGTVAGTLSLQGRIDSLSGWTSISSTTYTATDVASQKFIWPIAVQSFNGFRVQYTTTGTQSSSFGLPIAKGQADNLYFQKITSVITANLTVFREADGTLHMPNGSLLPVLLTCEPTGSYSVPAYLETVILKHVESALVVQSAWSTGAFVATKVTNACTGTFSYVAESINNVTGLQNPCCAGRSAPVITPPYVYECPSITVSSTGTGNVHVAFTAKASTAYIVHLYSNADGSTQLSQTTFTNGSGSAVAASSNFNSLSPGTYYVEVREVGSTTPCTIHSYVLAAPTYVCPSDVVVTGVVDHAHVTFTGAAGKSYNIYLWNDAGGTSANGGVGSVTNSDVSPAAMSANIYRASGTYYVEVRETGSTTPCAIQQVILAPAGLSGRFAFLDEEPPDVEAVSFSATVISFSPGGDATISTTGLGPERWVVFRFPASETSFLHWFNTTLNSGDIPDAAFEAIVTLGGFKYIKSRNALSFDTSQPLKFTH